KSHWAGPTERRFSPPMPSVVSDVATDLPCATCETTPATLPAPGTTPRTGCHPRPSGRRSARPGSPPHRFLDPLCRAPDYAECGAGLLVGQGIRALGLGIFKRVCDETSLRRQRVERSR